MTTILLILAIVFFALFLFFRLSTSDVQKPADCDMRKKYSTLVEHMLSGHREARIMKETGTEIVVGVDNYGGYTALHIQQETGNMVRLVYVVKNNPTIRSFLVEKRFRDNMDQNLMLGEISVEVQHKLNR